MMSLPPPRSFGVPAIILLSLVVVIMAVLAMQRGRVITLGQTVRFDDSFFTVKEVKRSKSPSATLEANSAAPVDYIVTLAIDNKAKRVPFRFSDQSLVLFDRREPGRVYRVARDHQRAYHDANGMNYSDPLVLKAGETATQDYVFSVPGNMVGPRLKFMPGGRIGETLGRLLGDYTEIQLP
jgi:hypothetical protein